MPGRLRYQRASMSKTETPIIINLLILMLLTFGIQEVVKPSLALTPSEGAEPYDDMINLCSLLSRLPSVSSSLRFMVSNSTVCSQISNDKIYII